jgi:branched-chain amino acid transport system substrate-binding protein
MKRVLIVALVLVMAVLTAGAADLKVAILAPLSGPVPSFGLSTKEGALLAIQEWNAKGGVLGMKIVPIVEDSQCTPDPAVNAANKVINQDGVHYIIGEVCSGASIPVSEIANAAKVVQISPTSTNPNVTITKDGKTKDYIFRACYIDPFQGGILATFSYGKFKARKAFIIYDQGNDYTVGLANSFESQFKKLGGTIVGKETYTSKDTDFSAILAKIKTANPQVVLIPDYYNIVSKVADAKPDVVVLPDYYNIVNLVTKQAKEKGINVPFVGGDGWDSADLDKAAAAGGFFSNHYAPDDKRKEVQDLLKAYGAAYKDDNGKAKVPDALAVLAYDATNLLFAAIKAAGKDDTTAVKNAIEKITFNGVSGKITMDKLHNPIKSLTMLAVKPDKIVFDSVVQP